MMPPDPEHEHPLQHYGTLSDEDLLAVDTAGLTEIERNCYDAEVATRGLLSNPPIGEPADSIADPLARIRRAALVAGVAATLGLLIPLWTSVQQMLALNGKGAPWWMRLMFAPMIIFGALSLAFFFALYRDRGTLRISRNLRHMSLAAALGVTLLIAFRIPPWVESFQPATVLSEPRQPWTMNDTSLLLSTSSDLGLILLLIAFYRQADSSVDRPVSRLLRVTTIVSAGFFGVTTAFSMLQLFSAPYMYPQIRSYAAQIGVTPPTISYFLNHGLIFLLGQMCALAAPLVVWSAIPKVEHENSQSPTT
jgi:hypothetical protein